MALFCVDLSKSQLLCSFVECVGRFGLCGLCYVGGVLGDRLVGSWRGWLNVGFRGVIEE